MKSNVSTAVISLLLMAFPAPSQATAFESLTDGRIRHTFSGFVFPAHIGSFERQDMHEFNQVGSDVSGGYNCYSTPVVGTVYVYPAPNQQGTDVLSHEYASKRLEVMEGHRGGALLSEGPVTLSQGGRKYSGRRAFFKFREVFAGTTQDLKSELLVFQRGPVFVEYRFTYPRRHAEQAEQEIERFLRAWSWRGSAKT